jgi:hypothetical protein
LWLHELNRYLSYFPKETPKQLDEDETNYWNLNQVNARDPAWHEAMVNANIDIFEMSYEKSVSSFKHLENLTKIRRTNGPGKTTLSLENKKSVTSIVDKSSKNHKG